MIGKRGRQVGACVFLCTLELCGTVYLACVAELGVDERINGLSVSLPTFHTAQNTQLLVLGGLLGLLVSLGHLCMTKGI